MTTDTTELNAIHLASLSLDHLQLEIYTTYPAESSQQALLKTVIQQIPLLWPTLWQVWQDKNVLADAAHGLNDQQTWEVDLTWVDNPTMQLVNQQYRGKDQPTDVLTFSLFADDPDAAQWTAGIPEIQLGSIFISIDYAQAALASEASDASDATEADLTRYVLERFIHGMLHIVGVHHDTQAAYDKVKQIQDTILDGFVATQP